MTSEITVSTDEQQDTSFSIAPELSHLKVTGGMCDVNDETIEKVYEEAGLHMVKVKSMVGNGIRFETGKRFKRQWLKLSFEVAIADTERDSDLSTAESRGTPRVCVAEERGS